MLDKIVPGLLLVLSQTQDGMFLKVDSFSGNEVVATSFQSEFRSFSQVLTDAKVSGAKQKHPVSSLALPFKHLNTKGLGFGLTYSDHNNEVGLSDVVLFEKNSTPTRLHDDISFRKYLDFETEVALLIHRSEPDVFGFLIHNDLSDRMIQALNYDKKDMAPGFSKAKSFTGSNANSVLLVIGKEDLWKQLKIDFFVNGVKRQSLEASKNVLNPREIHRRVFVDSKLAGKSDWVLVGTGTPGGTIFVVPTTLQMIGTFLRSGLSPTRTKVNWVESFTFLAPNDHLRWTSDILGSFETKVVKD